MSSQNIQLVVGLGNPGSRYAHTRHNAGFWLLDQLAHQCETHFSQQDKFFGEMCRVELGGQDIRLVKPQTYMNESGRSVRAVARFYKIPVQNILVAYDEIDLPPGKAKLKKGGGHGGHNGMRDIIAHLGADFLRLRVGVGHPGDKAQVVSYVLGKPSDKELVLIDNAIDYGVATVRMLVEHGLQKATHFLHSQGGPQGQTNKDQTDPIRENQKNLNQKKRVRSKKLNINDIDSEEKHNRTTKSASAQKPSRHNQKKPAPPLPKRDVGDGNEAPQRASLKDQLMALLNRSNQPKS